MSYEKELESFSIESLHDTDVDEWLYLADSDITTVAYVLGIDPHYLAVQVRLHLPFYDPKEIEKRGSLSIIREILHRISGSLDDIANVQKMHSNLNGAFSFTEETIVENVGSQVRVGSKSEGWLDAHWDRIPAHFGESIQCDLHYIHSARTDTILHAGLVLSDYVAPFCYASFSNLDREYLDNALTHAASFLDFGEHYNVAVMTRAYGYMPAPKNAMSKLFDLSGKVLQHEGYDMVITALNPFLGFRGSVFTGSSFKPFATSPMKYRYDNEGNYVTRRKTGTGGYNQRMKTLPIVWYMKPLTRQLRRKLEMKHMSVYNISDEEYLRG